MKEVIIDGEVYAKKTAIGPVSLIRTKNAGVHVGVIESHDSLSLVLTCSRRIWSWKGANTCTDIALYGIDSGESKISPTLPKITLNSIDVCEIIPMTKEAYKTIKEAKEWKA